MSRFKVVVLSICLTICPLALCYGQISYSGVSGERGYSSLHGKLIWDLDNNFILTPGVSYYRTSDEDEDTLSGATTKFLLNTEYMLDDKWRLGTEFSLIPQRLGYQASGYYASAKYSPFYRSGYFKEPYISLRLGQTRHRQHTLQTGEELKDVFTTTQTGFSAAAGTEWKRLNFQLQYDKVIIYSRNPPGYVSSNWAEIPFMLAVVQGFIEEKAAARVAYKAEILSPYAAYSFYQYKNKGGSAFAVSGGLSLQIGGVLFSGGVEVFEETHDSNRRTYFSLSAEREF